MTIDTKELRRLAQEAMHPVTKGRWIRLFGERTVYDRMEDGCRGTPVVATPTSPPDKAEAAKLDFIAAANPAAISELLDRLEAAEKELAEIRHGAAVANNTIKALRDKIAEMDKQLDGLTGTMRVLAARPAVDEGRNNWEAIVWESICFAEEAIARTTGDQP